MQKSRDAFRTISEVSDWLDTPTHVLRFWESKFSQIKPVKRAGGRRYYRPEDMELLGGIKKLLHEDGMTIKGVQKLLKEQGVRHVSALGLTVVEPQIDPVSPPAPEPEESQMDDEVIDTGAAPTPKARKEKPDPAKRDEDAAIGDLFGAGPVANVVPIRAADIAPAANSAPSAPSDPILALLLAADPARLRRSKARIRPLLDRLVAVHNRMQQD